jgi:hypothetical protein
MNINFMYPLSVIESLTLLQNFIINSKFYLIKMIFLLWLKFKIYVNCAALISEHNTFMLLEILYVYSV